MDPDPDSCPPLLLENIGRQTSIVQELQKAFTAAKALGPENGGHGEIDRVALAADYLKGYGIDEQLRIDTADDRVPCGIRPNLVARIPGKSSLNLWLFAHLDTVGAGDLSAWATDPFAATIKDDFIYGRGVEDNQQAACTMLILAGALKTLHLTPPVGLGLVFMADEECGSRYGLIHILNSRADLFSERDFYIVPDGGSPDGSEIEIAEKAQLWLQFTITGRQCHASNPFLGRNAFLAAAKLAIRLENELRTRFAEKNPLFIPPVSTFVPTRHPANVDGVNIMPGREEFYMDCRLLPAISMDAVLEAIGKICGEEAAKSRVEISYKVVQAQKATETPPDSPVTELLKKAIHEEYGVKARPVGIGGATVAAFLRDRNLPAVVWSCIRNTCHQPNECSSITATLKDAAVFARVLYAGTRYAG